MQALAAVYRAAVTQSCGRRALAIVLPFAVLGIAACESDHVEPGVYGVLDASVSPTSSSGGGGGSPDTGTSPSSPADALAPIADGSTPSSPECDMNGRWLLAERVVADAIGQKQASHNWFYYEIRQQADQVVVTKGLQCGFEVVPVTALGASVTSKTSWDAIMMHDNDTGRRGTMEAVSSRCQLSIEKRYTVRGTTVSFYTDPNQAMPTASQQASGSTPGWEDWDMDGNPGITLTVGEGGTNIGELYCAQRDWNQFAGAVPAMSTKFSVPATWGSEQDALGYSGSSLVTQAAVPDSDPSQNYGWFAKLSSTQATGDDATICASIRSLVPTLTPDALK